MTIDFLNNGTTASLPPLTRVQQRTAAETCGPRRRGVAGRSHVFREAPRPDAQGQTSQPGRTRLSGNPRRRAAGNSTGLPIFRDRPPRCLRSTPSPVLSRPRKIRKPTWTKGVLAGRSKCPQRSRFGKSKQNCARPRGSLQGEVYHEWPRRSVLIRCRIWRSRLRQVREGSQSAAPDGEGVGRLPRIRHSGHSGRRAKPV